MGSNLPTSMRAWLYVSTPGGLEKNLILDLNAAVPPSLGKLRPDQVLVEVYYASLNPVDYKIAENPLFNRLLVSKPASPGLDFAGRVVALGPNSGKVSDQELESGQLVFGKLDLPQRFGTLGQFIVAPRAGCAPLSVEDRLPEAASLVTVGLSAYQSIAPFVQPGNSVFINGGSGGTGTCGIQIAKELGCYVVTTCSSKNVDLCKSLGADEVISYEKTDLLSTLRQSERLFDLVVDNAGMSDDLFWKIGQVTKPGATFVQVAGDPSFKMAIEAVRRIFWGKVFGRGLRRLHYLGVKNEYSHLVQLGKWLQDGKLKPVIDEVFPSEGAPKAFEKLKSHRATGKVLVKMMA